MITRPIVTKTSRPFVNLPCRTSKHYYDLKTLECKLTLHSVEMRSSVLSPMHHLRRQIDSFLSAIIPARPTATLTLTEPFPTKRVEGWTSLYEMVTFRPDIGYSEALRRERWQKKIVEWAGWGSVGVGMTVAVVACSRLWRNGGLYRS